MTASQPDEESDKKSASATLPPERLEELKKKMNEQIVGQEDVVRHILARAFPKNNSGKKPLIPLFGPAGVGKSQAMKGIIDSMMANGNRAGNGIVFIDEPHKMSAGELSDALAIAMGQPTRKQVGEMAAQACRNGTPGDMVRMKPLRLKRGFAAFQYQAR